MPAQIGGEVLLLPEHDAGIMNHEQRRRSNWRPRLTPQAIHPTGNQHFNPVTDMIANVVGSARLSLASASGSIDYLDLIVAIGGVLFVLLATVGVVLFMRRWWQQIRAAEPTRAVDLIEFRALLEQGELSPQEFEAIHGVLDQRTAAPPSVTPRAASPTPPPSPQASS